MQHWCCCSPGWSQPPSAGHHCCGAGICYLPEAVTSNSVFAQGAPTLTKAGIAAGALGAALVVLFNEVGTAVEVLGAVAVGQFAFRNLLFNKDRGEATKQVK